MPPKAFTRAKVLLTERGVLADAPMARHVDDQLQVIDRELIGLVGELLRLLELHAPKLVATTPKS